MPDGVHVSCNLCTANEAAVLCTRARWGERMHNVACRRCGLVYANPRLDRTGLDGFYRDRIYPQYLGANGRFTSRLLEASCKQAGETFDFFVTRAGLPVAGKSILEIGCGLGDFLSMGRDAGADVLGVEMDGLYADFAERERGLRIIREHVEHGKFERQFEIIAMFHVLEHLEDPGTLLETIRPLLTPGGRLLIEVPNLMGPWRIPPGEFFRIEHLYNFSFGTLQQLLRRAGFVILTHDGDPFFLRVMATPTTPQPPDLAALAGEYQRVQWHLFKWRLRGRALQPYYAVRRTLGRQPRLVTP